MGWWSEYTHTSCQHASHASRPALIAEIKHRSPTRGLLLPHFDPRRLAQLYRENGAAAISVLTDETYFGGHLDHLRDLALERESTDEGVSTERVLSRSSTRTLTPRLASGRLPLLRKDFLCDPYQVYESRAAGADAILLIAAGLDPGLLGELHALALELKMTPLVEVHSLEEIQVALDCHPVMIGINNRDLRDFSVRIETTLRLRPFIPPGIKVVAESGIHTAEDAACLGRAGLDAILVGEAIVSAPDIAGKVRELAGDGVQA